MNQFNLATSEEINKLRQALIEEINIDLFNGRPTVHKIYQIYKQLTYAGVQENDREVLFFSISQFFKKRTRRNQEKEFYRFFSLPFNDEMRALFSLSYRSCDLDQQQISHIASNCYRNLAKFKIYQYGVDEYVLEAALTEAYRPIYHENEWHITLPHLYKKIKKILLEKNKMIAPEELAELFLQLSQNNVEKVKPLMNSGQPRPHSFSYHSSNTELVSNQIIKDSELVYIKNILNSLGANEIPEVLDINLFQNERRHPLVNSFVLNVKNYNLTMITREENFLEKIRELKAIVKIIKESGNEIIKLHQEMVQASVSEIERQMQMPITG